MSKKNQTAISPTRKENYAEWYLEVVKAAELAEYSSIRGCMVIKPWGYGIWENIKAVLDRRFKETGHQNAYFPLFIPLSYLEKEAEHVEGFAKECAVVTHHRLKSRNGKLEPAAPLQEPLVIRPTSEMIIGQTFSKWVQSHRDLPLLINQWANIVRWEMRSRLFLRTTEILWQEGHTVHSTKKEAEAEARQMLDVYTDFCRNYLAMPVYKGKKTEGEKFPGAVTTYCIEAMMQDGKALQAGTSHFLGQNFSKACDIKFSDDEGKLEYGWMTSWGVTTRLIGALIMTHSDDDGLVLPPRIASSHIVLLPLLHHPENREEILAYCGKLKKQLEEISYQGASIEVVLDKRDLRGGEKNWSWIKKGIPIRLEIGFREVESDRVFMAKRNRPYKDRTAENRESFLQNVVRYLEEIQEDLLKRAIEFRDQNVAHVRTKDEFYSFFENQKGFVLAHWDPSSNAEEIIQQDLNVTIRSVPLDGVEEKGECVITRGPSPRKVLFAKAY